MAAIDINVPAEQDTVTNTETKGGTIMSPDSRDAIADEATAVAREADARASVGDAEALAAQRKLDQDTAASDLAHQQSADQAAEHQYWQDRHATAVEAAANAEEKFNNHKFEDFWSHQNIGRKIASGFGLFLGGLGSAYLGQPNPAALALNREMDKDFERQKIDLDKRREAMRRAGENVNDLYTQEGHENAALAVKFAKANEATAAEMVRAMTEAGIPVEQAKTNATVQGLLARGQEKRREALQHYDRTFSNSQVTSQRIGDPNKGPTESQSKTSLTAEQMADSLKVISESPPLSQDAMKKLKNNELAMQAADTSAGKDVAGNAGVRIGRAVNMIPESKYEGLSPQEQTVANAWDNVKELYVRQFTGAGMPETEALRAAEQYGPRPGDSAQLIQQKFDRQERMVQQMRAQSPGGTAAMSRAGVPTNARTSAPAASNPRLDRAREALRDPEATPAEKRRATSIIQDEVKNRRAAGAR